MSPVAAQGWFVLKNNEYLGLLLTSKSQSSDKIDHFFPDQGDTQGTLGYAWSQIIPVAGKLTSAVECS